MDGAIGVWNHGERDAPVDLVEENVVRSVAVRDPGHREADPELGDHPYLVLRRGRTPPMLQYPGERHPASRRSSDEGRSNDAPTSCPRHVPRRGGQCKEPNGAAPQRERDLLYRSRSTLETVRKFSGVTSVSSKVMHLSEVPVLMVK